MASKLKILIFIDWFLPGNKAGGPIRSVSNIVNHLHSEYDFYLFTRDRDLNDTIAYDIIKVNEWQKVDNKYHIFYASPKYLRFSNIKNLINSQSFDIIYFNSLFSLWFTIIPLILLKYSKQKAKRILAPRGMLGSSSLNIKSTKKSVFIFLSKLIGLYKNIIWQTSTEKESDDVKSNFGKNQICSNTLNIPPLLNPAKNCTKEEDTLKLFFLSRLAPIKNLEYTIHILSHFKEADITLDIYGPIEDEAYWQLCKSDISKLSNSIKVNYKGSLPQNKIEQTLPQYHFLFLPTKHENFGYAIAEALSCGCPVIISNQTPWQDLENKQIGWDIDLSDEKKYIQTIQKCISMDNEHYQKMSKLSKEYVSKMINESNILAPYRRLFSV